MKLLFNLLLILLSLTVTLSYANSAITPLTSQNMTASLNSNRVILPKNYKVFVDDKVVINHPNPDFEQRTLPTSNLYKGAPGCYVLCYSHQTNPSVYQINKTMFVQGQVRVPGHYRGRICHPASYVNEDISKAPYFKALCQRYISGCANGGCWAGGDTGGWFGVQANQ